MKCLVRTRFFSDLFNQLAGFTRYGKCSYPSSIHFIPIAAYYSQIEQLIDVPGNRHPTHPVFFVKVVNQLRKPNGFSSLIITAYSHRYFEVVWQCFIHYITCYLRPTAQYRIYYPILENRITYLYFKWGIPYPQLLFPNPIRNF